MHFLITYFLFQVCLNALNNTFKTISSLVNGISNNNNSKQVVLVLSIQIVMKNYKRWFILKNPLNLPWQALPEVQDAVELSKKSRTEDLPSIPHNVHLVLSLTEPPSRYMQTLPNQNREKYYICHRRGSPKTWKPK